MAAPDTMEFTEITLEAKKKEKVPKRRLYFSDGCLDEYSTDEEEQDEKTKQVTIDPSKLTWVPYLRHMSWLAGTKALAVCDYLGENLAYFFGITSPKFQYEIDYYKQLLEEEEKLRKKLETEGWGDQKSLEITTDPPNNIPMKSQVQFNDKTNTSKESNLEISQNWERY